MKSGRAKFDLADDVRSSVDRGDDRSSKVVSFAPTPRSTARLAELESMLDRAIDRNPLLPSRTGKVAHVLLSGACGEPEALVDIAKGPHGRLVGHAFRHTTSGIAYAVITLLGWEQPPADARTTIAYHRRQVMGRHRFAPVFARSDGEVYAEASRGSAAVHRLALMIERLDPAAALSIGEADEHAEPDVRVLGVYWDIAGCPGFREDVPQTAQQAIPSDRIRRSPVEDDDTPAAGGCAPVARAGVGRPSKIPMLARPDPMPTVRR